MPSDPNACLEPDTLAEFFASKSGTRRREEVESHVDRCAHCRHMIAAYARASDAYSEASTILAPAGELPIAHTLARPTARHAGEVLAGRYELLRVVGEGGIGVVWAAHDRLANRSVALKILKETSPELSARSLREARASVRASHPAVLEVLDVFCPPECGGVPVLVMPLLEGESLDALLARRSPLDESEALELLEPVVAGMCAAHARHVIHRDLKPQNVFLARAGDPKPTVLVLDFGLSKLLAVDGTDADADRLTRTGAILGTPHYMAPEQLFGEALVDARADVWAIGAMLYECLSGKRPIEGRSYGQIAKNAAQAEIVPLRQLRPDIRSNVSALVARMLDKTRERRPDLLTVHAAILSRESP